MLVKLKFRMFANGTIYEQGEQEIPDGTPLPSTAVRIDQLSPKAEPKKEIDTLSGLLPINPEEKKK